MSFETSLILYLTDHGELSALVADRVTLNRLPEHETLPAVTFRRISAQRSYTFDPFVETDAWTTARVQFDCWANTAHEAMDTGSAVLGALSGFEGEMAGRLVGSSFGINEFDDYESATQLHRRTLEFIISYEDELAAS